MIAAAICAALYSIKGGQHWRIRYAVEGFAGIKRDAENNIVGDLNFGQWLVHRFMDGKVLSSIGFGVLVAVSGAEYRGFVGGGPAYDLAIAAGAIAALGWLAGVAPKMGRIAGDIGGYRGNWDADQKPYPKKEGKAAAIEGWKAGLQRGVFMGAMLALTTGNLWFIIAGATFPACVFVGISIQQKITRKTLADWHWYEVIFGAVIGTAF
jgi:hypothetical protein